MFLWWVWQNHVLSRVYSAEGGLNIGLFMHKPSWVYWSEAYATLICSSFYFLGWLLQNEKHTDNITTEFIKKHDYIILKLNFSAEGYVFQNCLKYYLTKYLQKNVFVVLKYHLSSRTMRNKYQTVKYSILFSLLWRAVYSVSKVKKKKVKMKKTLRVPNQKSIICILTLSEKKWLSLSSLNTLKWVKKNEPSFVKLRFVLHSNENYFSGF